MSRLTEILEATTASREGGFGAFARKDPQFTPRKKKPEWKNPNRTKLDDIKDRAGQMKQKAKAYFDKGYTSKSSREDRRQAKIQRASDSARAAIDAETPAAQKFTADKRKREDKFWDKAQSRSLTKDEYKAGRREFIDKDQAKKQRAQQTTKLVPLQQADEMKVRQLAKRLNAAQAEQLGQMIGNLINPPRSEGTAEQVAKRR